MPTLSISGDPCRSINSSDLRSLHSLHFLTNDRFDTKTVDFSERDSTMSALLPSLVVGDAGQQRTKDVDQRSLSILMTSSTRSSSPSVSAAPSLFQGDDSTGHQTDNASRRSMSIYYSVRSRFSTSTLSLFNFSSGRTSVEGATWSGALSKTLNSGWASGAPKSERYKGVREGRERGGFLPRRIGVGHTGKPPFPVPESMLRALRAEGKRQEETWPPELVEQKQRLEYFKKSILDWQDLLGGGLDQTPRSFWKADFLDIGTKLNGVLQACVEWEQEVKRELLHDGIYDPALEHDRKRIDALLASTEGIMANASFLTSRQNFAETVQRRRRELGITEWEMKARIPAFIVAYIEGGGQGWTNRVWIEEEREEEEEN